MSKTLSWSAVNVHDRSFYEEAEGIIMLERFMIFRILGSQNAFVRKCILKENVFRVVMGPGGGGEGKVITLIQI